MRRFFSIHTVLYGLYLLFCFFFTLFAVWLTEAFPWLSQSYNMSLRYSMQFLHFLALALLWAYEASPAKKANPRVVLLLRSVAILAITYLCIGSLLTGYFTRTAMQGFIKPLAVTVGFLMYRIFSSQPGRNT